MGQTSAPSEQAGIISKRVLTSEETAKYLGISMSYLYKLTMNHKIPHYKPMGKMLFFSLSEVEEWATQNPVATETELADRANRELMKGGAR